MATQCMAEMQLPPGFSIVVDDVDAEPEALKAALAGVLVEREAFTDDSSAPGTTPGTPCGCGAAQCSRDAETCSERIRQIQVEAQSRKNAFAKLLEEHAQVVLRVKQMEQREQPHFEDGRMQTQPLQEDGTQTQTHSMNLIGTT